MSMKYPAEEEVDAVVQDVLKAATKTALKFLQERMEEAIDEGHITKDKANEFLEIIQRELASILQISAQYIPLSERLNIAQALGSMIFTVYAAGAHDPRWRRDRGNSNAKQMRRSRAEKGKHDQRREIVRTEAEKALATNPELKQPRKRSALARKIHPGVNEQLRAIYGIKNPTAGLMKVETIRMQLKSF